MPDLQDRLQQALVGQYTLERELGRGGMAVVYLATDLKHTRPVALKVLRPELGHLLGRERFLREIVIAAQLQHPHIIPLYDSGSADGLLFYTMALVDGETLAARLEREVNLPIDEALRVTRQVAEALHFAHTHDVVHRDVKPENIYLSGEHVLVADFGIARAISEAGGTSLTSRGIAIGTPEYMSPEQASAAERIDGRSDQYSLACVLYKMLAGDPPFTGRTPSAILARHMQEPPPSLRVVRSTVPLAVQETVERALAKVPADRYPTVITFATALEQAMRRRWWTPRRVAAAVGLVLLSAGGAAGWRFVQARSIPLDANKVVVFPLVDRAPGWGGEDVASMIGTALEQTDPLKWIDGWTSLGVEERADVGRLTARAARRIARAQHARYYIDGAIVRQGDSATVILRLTDATGDSIVGRASATRTSPLAAQAGLHAVTELLPRLLTPGRPVDLSALEDRRPAAVASWLRGERAYRQSRFKDALESYRRAIEEDSALAVAALKGAWAAHWEHVEDEALAFVEVALTHPGMLPSRYHTFALGLRDYLTGAADSAAARFRRIVAGDPRWVEAVMGVGEVYYHLLPTGWAPDSAEPWFTRALELDHDFAPALFHLAEHSIRSGDVDRAERLVGTFRRLDPDTLWLTQLDLMLDCARDGPEAIDWAQQARAHPEEVVVSGKVLALSTDRSACAHAAFRAVLASPTAQPNHRWGAVIGLQSLLVAEGQPEAAREVVESGISSGMPAAIGLYVVDALAGVSLDTAREAQAVGMLGDDHATMSVRALWWRGLWDFRVKDAVAVRHVADELARRAAASGSPSDRTMADAMASWAALARGDTTGAVARFERLAPNAPSPDLAWGLWESLAGERVKLAELLAARGRSVEAYRVTVTLDHPQPILALPYLPRSLEVRLRLAEQLGLKEDAQRCRSRLRLLRRGDLAG